MVAPKEGAASSPQGQSPAVTALAMGPSTPQSASSIRSQASHPSKQIRSRTPKPLPSSPCVDVICCDADHSVVPIPPCTAAECNDCPASAPASPCSDIHHISSTCTEPTCAAASSSTSAVICTSAVECCADTDCPDGPNLPCSQAACSATGDCSSMTLAVPTISTTCCTDEACEPELSPRLKAKMASICDGTVAPQSHTNLIGKGHAHRQKQNECRECRGSISSVKTTEGGHLYSSFQELLDCCCCSMTPTIEQCCVGGQSEAPYSCSTGAPHPSPSEQQPSPDMVLSQTHQHHHESSSSHQHQHHSHREHRAHQHAPQATSVTPSSSTITNATQYTSPNAGYGRDQSHSRASTISTTVTPQPVTASPSIPAFPWSAVMRTPSASTPGEGKNKLHSSGASPFNAHQQNPEGVIAFEDILTELQSWNDCTFEQPHLHSSHGGCLPPAMTLCDSDLCQTSAPHSHWMPAVHQATTTQSSHSHHSHHTHHTHHTHQSHQQQQGDARPQQCQWGGCNERFWTVEELVAHVNHAHLARKDAIDASERHTSTTEKSFVASAQQDSKQLQQRNTENRAGEANDSLECLWQDCHQVPMPEKIEFDGMFTPTIEAQVWKTSTGESQQQSDKISLAILQHLLHDHLGQRSAPPLSLKGGEQPFVPSTPFAQQQQNFSGSVPLLSPAPSSWSSKKRKFSEASTLSSGNNIITSTSSFEPLVCRWEGCSAQFDSHSALTDHIETAHVGSGKAEYECRWLGCPRHASGQKFSQKQKVLRHIQTHTGDRPFKCEQCGKRFSEQNTLAQHMRTHTQERPYVCDFPGCGKAFSVAGSLTIHKRTHTGSKPFVCSFPGCGKAFAESSNLTKHMRTHTGDKPFRCEECGKCFSRPDQLGRHRKSHERKRAKTLMGEMVGAEV